MNFLNLNKHLPHTVGGSNYKIMLLCKPPKSSAFFFFYLHFQNGCMLKNFFSFDFFFCQKEKCFWCIFLPLQITVNNAEIQNEKSNLSSERYNTAFCILIVLIWMPLQRIGIHLTLSFAEIFWLICLFNSCLSAKNLIECKQAPQNFTVKPLYTHHSAAHRGFQEQGVRNANSDGYCAESSPCSALSIWRKTLCRQSTKGAQTSEHR